MVWKGWMVDKNSFLFVEIGSVVYRLTEDVKKAAQHLIFGFDDR
jgi:hypothetical protein